MYFLYNIKWQKRGNRDVLSFTSYCRVGGRPLNCYLSPFLNLHFIAHRRTLLVLGFLTKKGQRLIKKRKKKRTSYLFLFGTKRKFTGFKNIWSCWVDGVMVTEWQVPNDKTASRELRLGFKDSFSKETRVISFFSNWTRQIIDHLSC